MINDYKWSKDYEKQLKMQEVAYDYSYNEDKTCLMMNIVNSEEGIKRAIDSLKLLLKDMSKMVKSKPDYDMDIKTFISKCYRSSPSSFVMATDMYKNYLNEIGRNDISRQMFGRMMTAYIESEDNIYEIKRVTKAKGGSYQGIRFMPHVTKEEAVEQVVAPVNVSPVAVPPVIVPPITVPSISVPVIKVPPISVPIITVPQNIKMPVLQLNVNK